MKICLLNINSGKNTCINKDFMGGYGWAFNAGNSLPCRIINFIKRVGEKLPVMSFGYLAAILSKEGCTVEYRENAIPGAETVVIQSSMVEHNAELEWARRLRNAGKRVGFIGPFSSAMPEIFLKECDFLVRGEPEEAFYRIGREGSVKGIIESKLIDNLDSLPFPRWEIFPYRDYSYFPALKERPFLPVLSSRGCPYTCNYCPYLVNYKWRQRSAENVLDEIGYLTDRFKMKAMLFRDPIFTFDRNRTVQICEGILKRGFAIKWACETRLDRVDKELLKLMHTCGLRVMNVGIESSSDEIIKKASRKPVEIRHQEEMTRYCDKIGIRITAFYMFGMPDDTQESVEGTIRYAKKLNTHVAQFFIFTPFPGTQYYDTVKADITEKDWEKFDCYTPVFRHKNLSKEKILALKERAFTSYYYRLSWIVRFILRALRDIFNR